MPQVAARTSSKLADAARSSLAPAAAAHSLKPFLIGCVLILAIFEGLGVYVTSMPSHSPDFRTFYAAGYLLRTDRAHFYDMEAQARVENEHVSPAHLQLYFNHPAYEALVDAPFTLLPFKAAYRAFMVFNVVLMLLCVLVARGPFSRILPVVNPSAGLAMFLFAPLLLALAQGQDSILFLLCACLCWREMERGNDLGAGAALALALFRFQLAIPLAILLAVRRGWKFSAGFVAAGTGVAALCVAIVGVHGIRSLLRLITLTSGASQSAAAQTIILEPRAMANLRGLLYACATRWLSPHVGLLVVALASCVLLATCALWTRRSATLDSAFVVAVLGAILLSYHLFLHDVTLLLLPLVLLADRAPTWLLLTAYVTPAIALLLLGGNWYWVAAIPMIALLVYAARFASADPIPSPA